MNHILAYRPASRVCPRRTYAEKEAASRRATDALVLEDAERLIAAWNERQKKRMPMLPTFAVARSWLSLSRLTQADLAANAAKLLVVIFSKELDCIIA